MSSSFSYLQYLFMIISTDIVFSIISYLSQLAYLSHLSAQFSVVPKTITLELGLHFDHDSGFGLTTDF